MPFVFPINIIELIFKGMLIGIIASAPMGPIGVLCVQRTLNKGRWPGFATGVGAALSDIIYAILTGMGISFVQDFISQGNTSYMLKVGGSIILLLFGIYCFRSKPRQVHLINKRNTSIFYNAHTAFWVTFANPLIVLLFIASMAQLSFVVPNHPLEMSIGYLSIFAGALMWWFGLTWLIDKIRGRFTDDGVQMINKVIGTIVIIVSIVFLIGTVFNLYSLSWYKI
jgi:threonine/homoserine/homoserine lactone efflux protein